MELLITQQEFETITNTIYDDNAEISFVSQLTLAQSIYMVEMTDTAWFPQTVMQLLRKRSDVQRIIKGCLAQQVLWQLRNPNLYQFGKFAYVTQTVGKVQRGPVTPYEVHVSEYEICPIGKALLFPLGVLNKGLTKFKDPKRFDNPLVPDLIIADAEVLNDSTSPVELTITKQPIKVEPYIKMIIGAKWKPGPSPIEQYLGIFKTIDEFHDFVLAEEAKGRHWRNGDYAYLNDKKGIIIRNMQPLLPANQPILYWDLFIFPSPKLGFADIIDKDTNQIVGWRVYLVGQVDEHDPLNPVPDLLIYEHYDNDLTKVPLNTVHPISKNETHISHDGEQIVMNATLEKNANPLAQIKLIGNVNGPVTQQKRIELTTATNNKISMNSEGRLMAPDKTNDPTFFIYDTEYVNKKYVDTNLEKTLEIVSGPDTVNPENDNSIDIVPSSDTDDGRPIVRLNRHGTLINELFETKVDVTWAEKTNNFIEGDIKVTPINSSSLNIHKKKISTNVNSPTDSHKAMNEYDVNVYVNRGISLTYLFNNNLLDISINGPIDDATTSSSTTWSSTKIAAQIIAHFQILDPVDFYTDLPSTTVDECCICWVRQTDTDTPPHNLGWYQTTDFGSTWNWLSGDITHVLWGQIAGNLWDQPDLCNAFVTPLNTNPNNLPLNLGITQNDGLNQITATNKVITQNDGLSQITDTNKVITQNDSHLMICEVAAGGTSFSNCNNDQEYTFNINAFNHTFPIIVTEGHSGDGTENISVSWKAIRVGNYVKLNIDACVGNGSNREGLAINVKIAPFETNDWLCIGKTPHCVSRTQNFGWASPNFVNWTDPNTQSQNLIDTDNGTYIRASYLSGSALVAQLAYVVIFDIMLKHF